MSLATLPVGDVLLLLHVVTIIRGWQVLVLPINNNDLTICLD